MNLSLNKKNLIWSFLIFISILLFIILNNNVFFINNKFNIFLFSISILLNFLISLLLCLKIEVKYRHNKLFTIISVIFSFLLLYISIELLNKSTIFFIYPKRLLFNFLIIFLISLFIFCITNKLRLTILVSSSLLYILSLSSHILDSFRGFPLLPWDILSYKTATTILSTYNFNFTYNLILATLIFSLLLVFSFKIKYNMPLNRQNLIFRFFSIIFIIIFLLAFYKTTFINFFDFETSLWKPYDEYKNNGFLASFIKQTKNLVKKVPDDYSIKKIKKFMSKYIDNNNDENQIITTRKNCARRKTQYNSYYE